MAENRIEINSEGCKGCGLCAAMCPKNCIEMSKVSNKAGYFPAVFNGKECTACAVCALVCSDAAIEVHKRTKIVSIEAGKKVNNKKKEMV